jgi:hypothetical protein
MYAQQSALPRSYPSFFCNQVTLPQNISAALCLKYHRRAAFQLLLALSGQNLLELSVLGMKAQPHIQALLLARHTL